MRKRVMITGRAERRPGNHVIGSRLTAATKFQIDGLIEAVGLGESRELRMVQNEADDVEIGAR